MPEYRRWRREGGCYFFTVVTYERRSFLTDELARTILKQSIHEVQQTRPFELSAMCLLPDHLHCLWRLPPDDNDFSGRWSMIKRLFTRQWTATEKARRWIPRQSTDSRQRKRECSCWQRRFWEHLIRDKDDYVNHLHYIHYNPVKHGLVETPEDWAWSTFHRYVTMGVYRHFNWGQAHNRYFQHVQCND